MPAHQPPHKGPHDVAPADHRLRMLELAVDRAAALRIEPIELERSGPSYTFDTVRLLKERHPERHFVLALGLDAFAELHTWHRFAEIPGECDLVVTSRPPDAVLPGPDALTRATASIAVREAFRYEPDIRSFRHSSGNRLDFVPVTAIDISASAIRAAVAAGRSIRFLTPEPVVAYIRAHGLYDPAEKA
jgi:nicotinate-nucleotide adenylyltransferase